ncbi:MAG: ABC transporter substrate-binding protein [Pseudomonadota bacterium]
MVKWKFAVGLFMFLFFASTLCALDVEADDKAGSPGSPAKIRIAQPGHDDYGIQLYLADQLGFFKKEGLEVEFINFKSSPLSVAALLADEVQFCLTSYDQALKMFEKGKTLKNLFTTTEKHPWALLARSEIKTVADLKGKTISAKMPGSGPRAFAVNILLHYGLDPEKDVIFVDLPETAILPSYENKAIDATVGSGIRKTELLQRGARVLVDMNDPKQHRDLLETDAFPLKVVLATAEYIEKNPEIVQHFVNATVQAMAWEKEQTSREIAAKVAPYFLGSPNEATIDDVRRAFSHDGLITEEGHKALEKQSISVGLISQPVPMDDVVDLSFLKKALEQYPPK